MENKVIKLGIKDRIAVIAIEEREFKNTLSKQLMDGLINAFEEIHNNSEIRVVVIHGYDNYFCCGGTKEELFGLAHGKIKFSDMPFYDLALRCEIPVISAMQGHALGAGLAFGCYADIIVMGEECIYSANFMKYGFTPGMGATYIIPEKFGTLLGAEMMFRAENYFGRDLKQRGVQAKIVPKKDVISTAMKIAEDLADKPLLSLKLLKENQSRKIRSELADTIANELKMHEITFFQPEVIKRIETLFGSASQMPKQR